MLAEMGGRRVEGLPHAWQSLLAHDEDWRERGPAPSAYESFWRQYPLPASAQPIDTSKTAGARYEHWQAPFDEQGATLEFLNFGPRKTPAITTPAPRFTLQLQV